MSIARYIREIGRGRDGARSLDADRAHDLMGQLLDRQVSDLEVGAFAMAMRIKGESVDELVGFLQAAQERCLDIRSNAATVVLPSYNGSRKIPNLTALLAALLAQRGVQVLVHGVADDGARVTTSQIFGALGWPEAVQAEDIDAVWRRREPVFIGIAALCPPLAQLLQVRQVIGLRNSGHTIAKLLAPCRGRRSLRVVNYTHPDYGTRLVEFIGRTSADVLLMRGTEGEPVADARRQQKMDVYLAGRHRPELSLAGHAGVVTEMPTLPPSSDAPSTAAYIRGILSGDVPAPPAVLAQVGCLMGALEAASGLPADRVPADPAA
ncbi:MAG: DNA-binding protein YbiB [Pseudomonadota bacterium]|nr:DNA-binding protein YbiB [Pseudomonadota bacterium]